METNLRNLVFGEWYTIKKTPEHGYQITGYDPQVWPMVGVRSIAQFGIDFFAVEYISRRNHDGHFIDEANRIKSFYSATLGYFQTDDEKEVRAKYSDTHNIFKKQGDYSKVDLSKLKAVKK
jgi:hypothetical protein